MHKALKSSKRPTEQEARDALREILKQQNEQPILPTAIQDLRREQLWKMTKEKVAPAE